MRVVTVAMEYERGKRWHRAYMTRRDADMVGRSWDAWREAFLKMFVDESFADNAFQEWLECTQTGNENVVHYTERYEAAVQRVQESQETPVPDWDRRVVKRYVEGLRKNLRALVAAKTFSSVEAAVQ